MNRVVGVYDHYFPLSQVNRQKNSNIKLKTMPHSVFRPEQWVSFSSSVGYCFAQHKQQKNDDTQNACAVGSFSCDWMWKRERDARPWFKTETKPNEMKRPSKAVNMALPDAFVFTYAFARKQIMSQAAMTDATRIPYLYFPFRYWAAAKLLRADTLF